MELMLARLTPESPDIGCFERINTEAFPPSERMSMEALFDFARDTDTEILGLYDEKTPVGFTVLLKNAVCGYVYFLAIDAQMRSKGYGSAALGALREAYPRLQIILDFEEIDEATENLEQRIRRRKFYLRNGFHETGRYTFMTDDRFEVVCTGGELRADAFRELIAILHAHCPRFLDKLLLRRFHGESAPVANCGSTGSPFFSMTK